MDANQVGYVHEPTFEDTKAILDRAVSFKPKRQVIILFSGGEPTLSPYYLEAVAYAKKIGFYRILAATNGIRFAEDIEFCKAAKAAGQHGVYLQFDGVSEEKNKHRGVGNLFDVKLQAIENLASVGIKVTLVTTIVNTINNDGIGEIVEFAAKNIDKVQTIAFQPVSFTGRDEDVSDAVRIQQRYTLAGMTHDLKDQTAWATATVARLVSAFVLFGVHQRDGHAAGRRRAVGLVVVQLPSKLRHLHPDGGKPYRPASLSRCLSFSTTSSS